MLTRTSLVACFVISAALAVAPAAQAKKSDKAAGKQAVTQTNAKKVAKADRKKVNKTSEKVVAKKPEKAGATAEAEPAAPVETMDPLEAALAAAAENAEKTAVAPAPVTDKQAQSGLTELRDLTRSAAAADLLADTRNNAVPSGEVVEHMKAARVDQDAVSAVIMKNLDQLQYCYESLTARGKSCSGHTGISFVIEPKGHVSKIGVRASGKDAKALETCISRRIRSWRFPAADAPTTVDYPIVFVKTKTE